MKYIDNDYYTKTMADIYSTQGYYEKAVEIYNYLLEHKQIKNNIKNDEGDIELKNENNLFPLFQKWFKLHYCYNKLQKLQNIKNKLDNKQPNHIQTGGIMSQPDV